MRSTRLRLNAEIIRQKPNKNQPKANIPNPGKTSPTR